MITNTRNIERNAELKEQCNELLELSPKIRYAGIINEFGRTLAGKMKSGLLPLLSHTEARNEFFIHSMIFNLRTNYRESIGQTQFILLQSQKVNIISFIKSAYIYYLTIEREISDQELNDIINSIRQKLESFGD
jgi:hypothetical protein